MFAHETPIDNPQVLQDLAGELLTFVRTAATQGTAVHDVERELWQRLLRLGHTTLRQFFAWQGSGDVGDTVTLPDGQVWERLPELHPRRYVSIFGEFTLARTVYGSREGQRIAFVPLDNRLQLPESVFSYVLQDWDQGLCVEQAFGQAQSTVARMLNLKQSVDSLEQMNVHMAEQVTDFRENRPRPDPATERASSCAARRMTRLPAPTAPKALRRARSAWPWSARPTRWTATCGHPRTWWQRCSGTARRRRVRNRVTSACGPVCPRRTPTAGCRRVGRSS